MQAAANRLPSASRHRHSERQKPKPPIATAGDTGLLNALPIAAAIIERDPKRRLGVSAHNSRFYETVRLSTCTAEDWNEAECLKGGPIAELLHNFFDGSDVTGELDFRDG